MFVTPSSPASLWSGVVRTFRCVPAPMSPDDVKLRSEAFLREHDIAVNPNLPILETLDELAPQSAVSVASRAVILSYVVGLGFGQTGARMKQPLVDFGLLDYVSPNELLLLEAPTLSEQDIINCAWLTECLQSFGYCLGLAEIAPFLPCDDELASKFPPAFSDPSDFIAGATLRSFDDIYAQADLHYRMHWAARNSRLTGAKCRVKEGFIAERRKPLDWVIGVEADWDEVSMDT